MLGPTGHSDTFSRDRLPAAADWPEIRLGQFDYPEWLNAAVELTDRMVERGFWRQCGADRQRAAADLQGVDRLVKPDSACIG